MPCECERRCAHCGQELPPPPPVQLGWPPKFCSVKCRRAREAERAREHRRQRTAAHWAAVLERELARGGMTGERAAQSRTERPDDAQEPPVVRAEAAKPAWPPAHHVIEADSPEAEDH